ncbi:acyl-CoA dehydrogenase family protein [Microbacterium sp. M3]|uniref:Acyl-CoA dehydrogenase family protein n=1 Tax=Microbacterium arthrosphaerae TaxID=792652 RepID=A0ABU4H082_9MICO|nr:MULTISPECIES: acyl-CoA dehydrogenase family protein [Microbacterium]MDW4572738.1 acyl-CoA dehydrogenase family protein [Microbacterium arthrosphaerae]MDW7606593.1 acyl-CoA dehydrogenase family protein [Microbacterium sp. M3]
MTSFSRGQRVIGAATHYVENQPPWRVDIDEYALNVPLGEAVHAFGGGAAEDRLREAGALVGSEGFQRDAHLANVHTPVAHAHDRWGFRLDEVEYDPSYHRVIGEAIARGAHTSAWADPAPGAHVARAAMFMLFAQVEPGHACPVSMTHAAVASISDSPWIADNWLPRMFSRDYDPRLIVDGGKPSALVGMAMTEKQGGSDVRAGTTVGESMGGHAYQLTGHKWFCSAPMSDAFLVLAHTRAGGVDEGLTCLFVPRILPHGMRNVFRIQRLKDKLGNRSNASAEVEFDGTVGFLVGEPGRGVRTIIEMVQRTRLDCVLGTAAGMRQSLAEAVWHARGREAFGALLVDQPAMTGVLADLALEYEAAMLTGLRLAQLFEAEASDRDIALRRLATPVSKYWVCKRGPQHAYEALECLGGNGYTESFPLARRYREQPVMAIWEGSGNVIALDVLRALTRDRASGEAFADELASTKGASTVLDQHVERTLGLLRRLSTAEPATAASDARRLSESLALAFQASLMLRRAPSRDAEAFIGARLGEDRGAQYGVLPGGTDAAAIVARH